MTDQRSRPTIPETAWFKSSYSSGGGGECVEVAAAMATVRVRDSKVLGGPVLAVSRGAWAGFIDHAADRTA
jgi:hypothetical protein